MLREVQGDKRAHRMADHGETGPVERVDEREHVRRNLLNRELSGAASRASVPSQIREREREARAIEVRPSAVPCRRVAQPVIQDHDTCRTRADKLMAEETLDGFA